MSIKSRSINVVTNKYVPPAPAKPQKVALLASESTPVYIGEFYCELVGHNYELYIVHKKFPFYKNGKPVLTKLDKTYAKNYMYQYDYNDTEVFGGTDYIYPIQVTVIESKLYYLGNGNYKLEYKVNEYDTSYNMAWNTDDYLTGITGPILYTDGTTSTGDQWK